MTKLTNKKIRWIIRRKEEGKKTNEQIAVGMKITPRRVQQIYQEYQETGTVPKLNRSRRPKTYLTEEQRQIIDEAFHEVYLGARLLRHHIRRRHEINIPHNKIHEYLLEKGYAKPNPKKQKKRKRCRYERKHSLSLLHGDWFEWDGGHICGFEDDASRKMLALMMFDAANGENTLEVFKKTEKTVERFNGYIVAVNTDRGTQFYANKQNKKGTSMTEFQKYLKSRGIRHIPSRRNNPQTNGKFERWIEEYKKHRDKFNSDAGFMAWYNNRLHGALKLEWAETPDEAFIRKMRPEILLGLFFENVGTIEEM